MSAGIRSGVNWIRPNSHVDGLREGLEQLRLAQAGNAFEQRVPFAQQADQHRAHELVLPDDHTTDLIFDLARNVRVPFRAHWDRSVAAHLSSLPCAGSRP